MTTLKTIGTFAIIVGCFAIVYPRFLHPLILRAFGMNVDVRKDDESHFPPHMRNKVPSMDRRPPPMPNDHKDVRQHMRPGPHPGMRAAAEMHKQQAQGSGRGMMGIVLPMYAIGICVYLVYTLFKVFNKRGKYNDPYSKRRNEGDDQVDRMGFPQGLRGGGGYGGGGGGGHDYGEGEVQRFLKQKHQERELEDLLVKMDDTKNASEDEMRALQKRLEETEAQMTRILQAMQTMQSRVTTVSQDTDGDGGERKEGEGDESDKRMGPQVETVGSGANQGKKGKQDAQSGGSSPDTDSYEIIKTSASVADDASPISDMSSPSSFEQISKVGDMEGDSPEEQAEEDEQVLLDQEKKEEDESGVRQRKTCPAEDN